VNFGYCFTAPLFIKVLFLFILFTFPRKGCEIASLPLHGACPEQNEILPLPLRCTQSQGQNDRSEGFRALAHRNDMGEGLAMTWEKGSQ